MNHSRFRSAFTLIELLVKRKTSLTHFPSLCPARTI